MSTAIPAILPKKTQKKVLDIKQESTLILTKKQLNKIEALAKTAPWQKLDALLSHNSKAMGQAFQNPIFLMKLLVLQELFSVDVQQLRSHLGQQYSLFVFFIPGMEKGLPKISEIKRLQTRLHQLNLLHPFLSECVDVIGLDRSKTPFYLHYYDNNPPQYAISVSQQFKATGFASTLACPRCSRRRVREGEQTLIKKIFTARKSYICNSCTFHFDL
jgi:hypothetical protein